MNVNVGSGYLVLEGFINLDNSLFLKLSRFPLSILIKPFLSAEKRKGIRVFSDASRRAELRRYDCRKSMPFRDGSVSHIVCSHFLEHLYHDESQKLLKEFFRVLRPGGTVHIVLPDLGLAIERYYSDKSPEAADKLMSLILAYEKPGLTFRNRLLDITGNYGLHHLWMYDRKSMEYKMENIGFTIDNALITPSAEFRKGDDSLHIVASKK